MPSPQNVADVSVFAFFSVVLSFGKLDLFWQNHYEKNAEFKLFFKQSLNKVIKI